MAGLNLNLNAITENASRLGARIQESITEHTRDLAITRSQGSSYFEVPEEKVRNVRKQLDSSSDREKLDALKTLIALISKGRNVSEFFPYVVKNVASQNLEIRKLVYIFLLRYAESDPDLALLSINTFQKDLTDSNPLIRAMALRVLSGINVPMIGNIIVLAIKKCAGDPSPYVRKASALASIKCYNMDSSHLPSLIPILETLLKDRSPLSVGTVAVAFQAICPTRLDLLHKHYRRLCRMLIDADAWGQVSLLDLLSRYARSMLSRPTEVPALGDRAEEVDPDLQLLLSNAEPLFMSNNPAVVMSVTRVFYYLGPRSVQEKIVNPLLQLLHVSKEIEQVVLSYIVVITRESPELFASHYPRFFVRTADLPTTKRDKIRILLKLVTRENYQALLQEFIVYADDLNENLVDDSIAAIGQIAKVMPDSISQCLSALMDFIKHGSERAIAASVLVLKLLVQAHLQPQGSLSSSLPGHSPVHIVADLAGRIEEIRHASARACIVWLVGQFASVSPEGSATGIPGVAVCAPDVLRRMAKTFAAEDPVVKMQLVTLAAKLHVLASDSVVIGLLTRYVFSLARYDSSFDVRDRARFLGALLTGVPPSLHLRHGGGDSNDIGDADAQGGVVLRKEQVRVVLLDGKLTVQDKNTYPAAPEILGSLDAVTGKTMGLESSRRLPDWPEDGTDSSLRDTEEEYSTETASSQASMRAIAGGLGSGKSATPIVLTPTGGSSPMGSYSGQNSLAGKGPWMDLDKFYEDANSDDEDDGSEDDDDDDDNDDAESENDAHVPSLPPQSHVAVSAIPESSHEVSDNSDDGEEGTDESEESGE